MRVGINGFGRMGRLALRAGWGRDEIEFVAINEPNAPPDSLAIILEFDTVQGRWAHAVSATSDTISVDGRAIATTRHAAPADIPWSEFGVDVVLESSGKFRTTASLAPHFERGARKVLVSAPVKDGPPNVVFGVNHEPVDFAREDIVTAASCTTNCLAPIVRVLHDAIGIERGTVTTIHDPTNTQRVVDAPHTDPRRARAAQQNLIPTSTNSATAVTLIVPELTGKLDSIAVRAPVLNASLVDFVFTAARDTTVEEVNASLERAARTGPLAGILGYETRPLVSSDYAGDPRSGIVDAASTRVVDRRLVKVLAWYDNEWGYANRMVDLLECFAAALER
ncbi:MAG: ArsJ-associated glyceraldehyde-3-phosphate dehydrogenase [Planctomycetes bacterium]|nr:ArsJ-associated glyceraldehyde-3-phosphate dehydrogenase [Planctomycetota bacterium]